MPSPPQAPQRPHPRANPRGGRPQAPPTSTLTAALALAALTAWTLWDHLVAAARPTGRLLAVGAVRLGRAADQTARWSRRHGPPAARALRRGLIDHVAPRAALVARVGLAIAAVGLARAALVTARLATWAGIHLDRARHAALDRLSLLVVVGAPAAWRRLHPVLTAAASGAATGGRKGWAALRAAGPRTARAVGVATGVAAGVTALGLGLLQPGLVLAATAVDPGGEDGRLPPLAERSVVRAADGSVLARWHGEVDRRTVPLEAVPVHVRHAVISAEDRRFREHDGYDLVGLARAAWANLRAGQVVQGGSTITQQVAKQSFVGDAPTVQRKARELVHAVALERDYDKARLLQRYLNEVYFGSGAYGVAAAAEELFAVDPKDLTVGQAAVLAGLIRSPGSLDPRARPDEAQRRRDAVLARMVADGHLSNERARRAVAEPVEFAEPREDDPARSHVLAAVRRELRTEPVLGSSPEERAEQLRTGGLEIHTTIDPDLQQQVDAAVAGQLPAGGVAAAVAAVDPPTGAVRAVHGGADFGVSEFDLATQARRQPASTIKPFVAAAALEAGHNPDAPLPGGARATFDVGGQRWRVRNYDGIDHGRPDLAEALRNSVNTAFAGLIAEHGVPAVTDVLDRVGIPLDAALGPRNRWGPSIALGGMTHGTTPLELAAAYAPFATGGRFADPHLVARVVDRDGNEVLTADGGSRQALEPEVAEQVGELLHDVVRDGTGTRAQVPGVAILGKTGTSDDGADAWFVGGDASLMAAVWVGNPDGRVARPGASGGTVAAPLWREAVGDALAGHSS